MLADITIILQAEIDMLGEVPFGAATGEPVKLTGIVHPVGSELTVARATRSKIDAFGIQYDAKAAFSTSRFSWAA